MLRMEHIHLAFQEVLIEDGTLEVQPGCLTVIKGASGKGKSSLLYMAGLLMDEASRIYHFDGYTVGHQDSEMASFRQQYIGYVFQDNSLISHLSLYENLKLYADMVDRHFTLEEAKHLLQAFRIGRDPLDSVTTLSGGEKQRLAIACAMVKKTRLLILDQPTSALDRKNSELLLSILKELAQGGMMILIASHDPHVFAAGDVIYEIEDQKLIKTRSHEAKQTKKETLQWQKHPLKAIFFMRYYLTYLKKNWGLQVMMLTLCGITMAILVSLSDISETFLASQQQSLDQIANREIVIASQDLNGKGYYDANLPLLEEGAMDTIAQLDHVQSVYPFFEGYCDEATANGKTVIDELVIQPYAPDRQIANQCHMTSGEAGQIYLSSYASEFFEMDRLDGQTLSLRCPLPDGTTFTLQDAPISGILQSSVKNLYTSSTAVIYVPWDWFPEIEPQSLLIYADHFQNIKVLGEALEKMDPEWSVFTHYLRDESMMGLQYAFSSVAPFMTLILGIITVILVTLLYVRYITPRKKEFCLLKVNGLSRWDTVRLILIELILQTIVIVLASLVALIVIQLGVQTLLGYPMVMHYLGKLVQIGPLIFVIMLVPSLLALLVFQRMDVALVLRETTS